MWIFSQQFGKIYYRASMGSPLEVLCNAYSGQGDGRNNPLMQCFEDRGPIPVGRYIIGAPFRSRTNYSLRLTPDPFNDMCNPPRHSFLIHGGDRERRDERPPYVPGFSSEGCIVADRQYRERIWTSNDHELLVVKDVVPD